MRSKLTLRIKNQVLEKANQYASRNNTTISRLVENYLSGLPEINQGTEYITSTVKSLSGVISMPKNFNYKRAYGEFLRKKYNN